MNQIETMTVEEAAKKLRKSGVSISSPTLWDGIEHGQFPFGNSI